MIKKLLPYGFGVTLLTGMASVAGTGPARAYTGQKMSTQAKVTTAQARKVALSAQSGTITDEELEREPVAADFATRLTSRVATQPTKLGSMRRRARYWKIRSKVRMRIDR